jgi:hypothetical protein
VSDDRHVLIHPTYRHIDRPVHIAGLAIGQWLRLGLAAVIAWALTKVLPFSATYDVAVAVTVAGTPLAVSLAAGSAATGPVTIAARWLRWQCRPKLYAPNSDEAESCKAGPPTGQTNTCATTR